MPRKASVADVQLRLGDASQQITVNEDAPLVNVTNAETAGLVHERQIQQLPLNGRSYDELLTLNPGVVNFTWEKTGGVGVSNSTVGNNFAVAGKPAAAESVSAERRGIHRRGGEQHAARRHQPAIAGRRRGARVQCAARYLRRGVRQTPGRPGPDRHAVRAPTSSTARCTSSCATTRSTRAISSIWPPRRAFSAISSARRSAGRSRKNKTFSSATTKDFRQHLHQTGVDLVPDTNARNGYLPCKLVTPAPSPCPASGLVFVGVSPLINCMAGADRRARRISAASPKHSTIRCKPSATISAPCGWIISSPRKDTLSAVYTVDDSADFTPTSTNSYSTDVESLREQVASMEETHVFSPALLNTARVGFSRAGYFFTGEPTPGTPPRRCPAFSPGIRSGAMVVGGSAASNPTAQLSLAGSNNGSNLHVARNLFTYEDRVSFTTGRHQIHFRRVVPAAAVERKSRAEPVRAGDVHQPADACCRARSARCSTIPTPTPLGWRSLVRRLVRARTRSG